MFFSVFNIFNTKNKLNAKYKTKNIKTDPEDVFFAIMNQTRTKPNSSRNLRLKETNVCMVWLRGSLDSPLRKMITDIRVMNEKRRERIKKSLKRRFDCSVVKIRYPAERIKRLKKKSGIVFLNSDFTLVIHLIKSLTAV